MLKYTKPDPNLQQHRFYMYDKGKNVLLKSILWDVKEDG